MFTIKKLNNISSAGLDLLPSNLYETASDISNPDGILLRSYNMLDMEIPSNLKAVARAGAGVNNIPIDKCTERGIAVFNTPGANANAVKELVITSLLLSSRKILAGAGWAQSLAGKGREIPKLVEKGKSTFEGPEIRGKKLGVIGLGAIGVMVANDALALGMDVMGYDPFISINAAWELSSSVMKAPSLDHLISNSDYITIHIPLNSKTENMLDKDMFDIMKKGVRIINLARGGLINNKYLIEAIENETVSCYVTDFPEECLLGNEKIIALPHLGASTPESEENCAVMAVSQLRDFLEKGHVKNSVNLPDCELSISGDTRLVAVHDNVPNMLGQVTSILAKFKKNINDMISKNKGTIAYTIIDVEGKIDDETLNSVKSIPGIKNARLIKTNFRKK